MSRVISSIDGSSSAPAVSDYAAWSSLRLGAPLTFLHVLERQQDWVISEVAEDIGLDEQLRDSQAILAAAKARVIFSGIDNPEAQQRRGELVEILKESDMDLSLS